MSNPTWTTKWELVEPIGGGGQGDTSLVRDRATGTRAVLKKLKRQDDANARRRMFQEVNNLRVLENAGCRVPAVLDSNAELFESPGVELYFVMEYVAGKNLVQIVEDAKGLTLEQSVRIARFLLATIARALGQSVIHRDLKPDNIIVVNLEPVDVVVVDYGLSFNQQAEQNITHPGERLDNSFLSLPERRVPGGDRRDPRSDLTAVCGILYYCITGEKPVDLADASGNPPHRRPGRSIREKLVADPRLNAVDLFFDRGFATVIDSRFQTVTEIAQRLEELLEPVATAPEEDLNFLLVRSAQKYLKHDRKTQLALYRSNSAHVMGLLENDMSRYRSISPYSVIYNNVHIGEAGHPTEVELLGLQVVGIVSVQHHPHQVAICYEIGAVGTQCALYRRLLVNFSATKWTPESDWKVVSRYNGTGSPEQSEVQGDLEACIRHAVKAIDFQVLGDLT